MYIYTAECSLICLGNYLYNGIASHYRLTLCVFILNALSWSWIKLFAISPKRSRIFCRCTFIGSSSSAFTYKRLTTRCKSRTSCGCLFTSEVLFISEKLRYSNQFGSLVLDNCYHAYKSIWNKSIDSIRIIILSMSLAVPWAAARRTMTDSSDVIKVMIMLRNSWKSRSTLYNPGTASPRREQPYTRIKSNGSLHRVVRTCKS